mmetsp:Transcript_46849/g.130529  ORF Transcript_46849/g.130529 Transcript_46849/m.130529 type:complete len:212 (-) Transcript_46849:264-899(-)
MAAIAGRGAREASALSPRAIVALRAARKAGAPAWSPCASELSAEALASFSTQAASSRARLSSMQCFVTQGVNASNSPALVSVDDSARRTPACNAATSETCITGANLPTPTWNNKRLERSRATSTPASLCTRYTACNKILKKASPLSACIPASLRMRLNNAQATSCMSSRGESACASTTAGSVLSASSGWRHAPTSVQESAARRTRSESESA